jgi:hypothetical protein
VVVWGGRATPVAKWVVWPSQCLSWSNRIISFNQKEVIMSPLLCYILLHFRLFIYN